MDNYVYLFSRNLQLMKCFLDYDCVDGFFKVAELSTRCYHFNCNTFDKNKNMMVVIDDLRDENLLPMILELQQFDALFNICIYYAGSSIDSTVYTQIRKFKQYKIVNRNLDFLTFLNWLQTEKRYTYKSSLMIKEIHRHLLMCGISAHVLGFLYLESAILLKSEDSKMKLKEICDKIAREQHTTSSRVERCMRTALHKSDVDKLVYIGLPIHKVSCKEFIAQLADHIIIDHGE